MLANNIFSASEGMSDGCRGQMGAIVAWVGWIGVQKVNITGGNTPNVHGIILAICDVICSEVERRILGPPQLSTHMHGSNTLHDTKYPQM